MISEMHCAECSQPMNRRDDGAWNVCCNGAGYWYNKPPIKSDKWWPVLTKGKFTFYPTVYWNKDNTPIRPKE